MNPALLLGVAEKNLGLFFPRLREPLRESLQQLPPSQPRGRLHHRDLLQQQGVVSRPQHVPGLGLGLGIGVWVGFKHYYRDLLQQQGVVS